MLKHEKPVIVIHGGAGAWTRVIEDKNRKSEYLNILRDTVLQVYEFLLKGGEAVDAVVLAIKIMEDSGMFNAGIGSVLNLRGEVEMDAGLMDGRDLSVGAVAAIKLIKNPIILAKEIMKRTDHVLLVGNEADNLGLKLGFEKHPGPMKIQKERYEKTLQDFKKGKIKWWKKNIEMFKYIQDTPGNTVGAVALDKYGNVAAGSSTGGVILKLPGRVGDSPIPGAGFYADNRVGAATATGIGEYIIRSLLSKTAVDFMSLGLTANEACKAAISRITTLFGKGTAGMICVDIRGYVGMEFNTEGMSRALMSKSLSKPYVAIFKEVVTK